MGAYEREIEAASVPNYGFHNNCTHLSGPSYPVTHFTVSASERGDARKLIADLINRVSSMSDKLTLAPANASRDSGEAEKQQEDEDECEFSDQKYRSRQFVQHRTHKTAARIRRLQKFVA